MEPNFDAFQLIGQIALGIIGFSAILIGLSRKSDGFSAPDNFRIQLLSYSSIGAMFCALIPFAVFGNIHNETSWLIVNWILCLYSVLGLFIFPKRVNKIIVYFCGKLLIEKTLKQPLTKPATTTLIS